jgi:solute carrier family 20 (sodium-dependent phosphate transporter)
MSGICGGDGAEVTSCQAGIYDCCSLESDISIGTSLIQCAPYNEVYTHPDQLKWVMVASFVTMALMSFGIGANDAANSWGTSVGSGAVSLKHAVIVGGLMDWLGAIMLGAGMLLLPKSR